MLSLRTSGASFLCFSPQYLNAPEAISCLFMDVFPPFFPADNVHFQQSAQISKALVDAGVDFQAMV